MLESKLDLIGKIILICSQHLDIKEKIALFCKEIRDFFSAYSISYTANYNKPEKIITLPENEIYFSIDTDFFIKNELKIIKKDNFVIYNFPVKDSFYSYGALQLVFEKNKNNIDEKLISILCLQLSCGIFSHRLIESFEKKLNKISKQSTSSNNKRNYNFFYYKLIKLVSKMFKTHSKIKIIKYLSSFLMFNNYINIDEGIFYLASKDKKLYLPVFYFNKNDLNFVNFSEALERIDTVTCKAKLKNFPEIKSSEDFFKFFNMFNIFNIGDRGYFLTKSNFFEIKFLLKLLDVSLDYAENFKDIENLQKKIEKISNDIIKSEHISNIKELVNQISHEIKNPMVAISGFAQRIFRNVDKENDVSNIKKYAQIIVEESSRLENLLNDLIAFNTTDKIKFKKVSIYSIIEKTINLMKLQLEDKNIELIFEYKKVPKIKGDFLQLRQVFFNILSNAIEAVKSNGKIFIKLFSGEKYVIIQIEDNGNGIPENILQNIFNPFFTTKTKGTGLGLSITYKIIKNHNGNISVENLKKGTRFTIKLPIGEKNEKENSYS